MYGKRTLNGLLVYIQARLPELKKPGPLLLPLTWLV
jgi:hypothetical protein